MRHIGSQLPVPRHEQFSTLHEADLTAIHPARQPGAAAGWRGAHSSPMRSQLSPRFAKQAQEDAKALISRQPLGHQKVEGLVLQQSEALVQTGSLFLAERLTHQTLPHVEHLAVEAIDTVLAAYPREAEQRQHGATDRYERGEHRLHHAGEAFVDRRRVAPLEGAGTRVRGERQTRLIEIIGEGAKPPGSLGRQGVTQSQQTLDQPLKGNYAFFLSFEMEDMESWREWQAGS